MASASSLVDHAGIKFKGLAAELHQLAGGKNWLTRQLTLYDLRAQRWGAMGGGGGKPVR